MRLSLTITSALLFAAVGMMVATNSFAEGASSQAACTVTPDPLSLATWTTLTVTATELTPGFYYEVRIQANGGEERDAILQADANGVAVGELQRGVFPTLDDLEPGEAKVVVSSLFDHDAGTSKNVPGNRGRAVCYFQVTA